MKTLPSLGLESLIVGHIYSAKKPKRMLYGSDNRTILWIDEERTMVQYDSDTVKIGRKQPTIPIESFLKWAKEDLSIAH